MAYERPRKEKPLAKFEKLALLEEYREECNENPDVLNQKLPRRAFADLLNEFGNRLLTESKRLVSVDGDVATFLVNNPLPKAVDGHLPPHFRVFCLALNALKQWVAAEQNATDCYLLGRDARELCREKFGSDVQLHHPVRDGRPPIPLTKQEHARIEGQLSFGSDDPIGPALSKLRRKGHHSWTQLRLGCLDLIAKSEGQPLKPGLGNARAFAKNATVVTKVGYQEILVWLDKHLLGNSTK